MARASVTLYRQVLAALTRAEIPFLVGGGFAYSRHARIARRTYDLDLMIEEPVWPRLARALRAEGIYTKRTFPHWLGKALGKGGQVDVIFNGGAGLTPVDAEYFEHAVPATMLGQSVLLCPAEELIWSKAFIMERERFDGADILHIIRARAEELDWARLARRFAGHEAVLLVHLILFRYAYPSETQRVPDWLVAGLWSRAQAFTTSQPLCRGTFLSRAQYLMDVEEGGCIDARLQPFGPMSARDWLIWTNAIDPRKSRVRSRRRTSIPLLSARPQSFLGAT
jgi:hypothetical protein